MNRDPVTDHELHDPDNFCRNCRGTGQVGYPEVTCLDCYGRGYGPRVQVFPRYPQMEAGK